MSKIEDNNLFGSAHEKYIEYNFQRQDYIEEVLKIIRDNEGKLPRIVALSGEPGIGREYFIRSVAYMASQADRNIRVASIDLDGYELTEKSLEQYANYQISRSLSADKSHLKEIQKHIKLSFGIQVGIWQCSLISMLFSIDLPIGKLRNLSQDLRRPARKPRETLSRLIQSLTEKNKLIIYVKDNEQLTVTYQKWLLEEVKRHRNLIVAFSCRLEEDFRKTVDNVEYLHFELKPHNDADFRNVINARFDPNTFPNTFYAVLWHYSSGRPADLANKFFDLVKANLVCWDGNNWYLTDQSLSSDNFVKQFSADFYEPIDKLREELPSDLMEQLESFLQLAVMCGKYIPIKLILQHMALSEKEIDRFINLIDEKLVEGTQCPIFHDYEYNHPGFKNINIYAFKNRTLRRIILERVSTEEQSQLALRLLGFLKTNLPITSRAIARLFLELSRFLKKGKERQYYEQYLAWWSGTDEAEELSKELIDAIKKHRLSPDILWSVLVNSKDIWPAYRRMAVLEAFAKQPDGVPFDLLDKFYDVKMSLLFDLGLYEEAEYVGRTLLAKRTKSLGPEHPEVGSVLNNLGLILRERAKYKEAESLLRKSLTILKKSLGHEHPQVATALDNLALLLQATNRLSKAEQMYRQALAIRENLLRSDHPDIATSLNNLAELLRNKNLFSEAEALYHRALEIYEKSFGPDYPFVATVLNNLAQLFNATNRLAEAESLMKRALEIDEKSFGKDHPKIAIGLNNLAELLRVTNRLKEAEPMYWRIIKILEDSLGLDHPNVATALNNLAQLLQDTNRLSEAEALMRRALEIDEKFFGSEHPNVACDLNNLAILLENTGRVAETEPIYRRALSIDEKSFGSEHPDVARDLNNLALLFVDTNRISEAEPLMRRALEIFEKSLGPDHPNTQKVRMNLESLK